MVPENGGSQVGALDLEASLTSCVFAESQIVHHSGGEEQLLVVGGIGQAALVFGHHAGEQEASDAVIGDGVALRGPHDRQAGVGERAGGEGEDVVRRSGIRRVSDFPAIVSATAFDVAGTATGWVSVVGAVSACPGWCGVAAQLARMVSPSCDAVPASAV